MAKYSFESHFVDDEGTSSRVEGVISAQDEDDAIEKVNELFSENLSVERVETAYRVTITLSFDFLDEDGQYEDESEVQSAFERGDEDFTSADYEVDEVQAEER
jgi:hypothetical protein